MAVRALISTPMLQIVVRASMLIRRTPSPTNSATRREHPPAPIFPMMCRIRSLE